MTLALGNVDITLSTTTTNAVLASAGGAQILFVKVSVCNTDVAQRLVTVWRVPSGGAPASGNIIWDAQPVAAGATGIIPIAGKSLVNGQQLFASADAGAKVNLSADYATL